VKRFYLMSLTLIAGLLMAWYASPCVLGVVMGNSMTPTLQSGQFVAIDRHYYRDHRPRAGEIVVFRHQGITYIKRVYAAEGETIYLLAEGPVGERTLVQPIRRGHEQSVGRAAARTASLTVRRIRVPAGSFYALGDALNNSIDSRELGPIDTGAIIGRVAYPSHLPAPDLELELHRRGARVATAHAETNTF
jgi:signal peptidase I